MTTERSLIPEFISERGNKIVDNIIVTLAGSVTIALLAQISIPLSFTPVPLTGQTFGVSLISLLWGRKRGSSAMLIYLLLGGLGIPIFAAGKAGFTIGPTSGYLLGMLGASYLMGTLADMGWTGSFLKTWLAAFLGSCITFLCGLTALSFFVPTKRLLVAGLFPFLPGDLVKTLLACWMVRRIRILSEGDQ